MAEAFRDVDVTRVRGAERSVSVDRAATEEPLEVRVQGRPFAVIMRTPGADRELAAGFLFAERVLRTPDDLGTIEFCRDADHPENVVNVTVTNGADAAVVERRQTVTSSSCGLCGRQSIESLTIDAPALPRGLMVAAQVLEQLPTTLRAAQVAFDETGGLHAAGLFTADGRLDAFAEDVGRHNAVDKVIGRMMMRDLLPLAGHLLFVSGRTSFEIVQKAFLAGISCVAAVSAPSSLAIDLAVDTGITLVGFVRGNTFTIYAHPDRII